MSRAPLARSALALTLASAPAAGTTESIEFVGEHLSEIAMDNRYATLPLWADSPAQRGAQFTVQAAYAQTHTGTLAIDGPLLSFSAGKRLRADWNIVGFAFFDDLKLSSGIEHRPLEVLFSSGVPLSLPAQAEFTGLSGSARNAGVGFAVRHASFWRLWNSYAWSAGLLFQRVTLRNYSFDFRVLDGADAGATGTLDYSATYSHITPFVGLAWPRERGNWGFSPHVQAAIPLPRRGVVGHIVGPGYDLAGDTGMNGDTPFGDPSLTVGFDLTYHPWNLTIDLGSAVSQALLEPMFHEGVDHNWMISASWNF